MSKNLSRFLRGIFGLLAVGVLLFVVDVHTVVRALSAIGVGDLIALLGLSVALILVSVIKWQAFLGRLGIQASLVHLFRLYLVGYFVNLFMPSSIGGDVVRSLYVGRDIDKVRSVSATLLERYTGLIAMVCMSLVAVWWAPQVTMEIRVVTVGVGLCAALLTVLLVSNKVAPVVTLLRVPTRAREKLIRLHEGMQWGLSDKRLLVKAGALSVLFHLLTVVNTAVVGAAVGWQGVPWSDLLVVVPLILLVGAIPVSPQGLGIQEGAFIFFLSSVGATTAEALAVALVLRAKSYVLAGIGGVLWLGLSRRKSDSPDDGLVSPEYPTV